MVSVIEDETSSGRPHPLAQYTALKRENSFKECQIWVQNKRKFRQNYFHQRVLTQAFLEPQEA